MNNQQRWRSPENPTLSPVLPQELIVEILLRLPVRSLLRFKSVCKSWLSLISDPKFGKSHFDLAAAPTHRCLVAHNDSGSEFESLDIDAPLHKESSVVNLKYPLSIYPERFGYSVMGDDDYENDVEFLGSCRGFVLVSYPDGDVYLWNPSTGVHRRIADELGELKYQVNGFGYDTSTDDYLLVLLELIPIDYEIDRLIVADHPTRINIFSMKSNSWYYQQGTYVQYEDMEHDEFKVGSFLNEALHWLVTAYETNLQVVIAFDLVERSLSEIPLSQVLARKINYRKFSYHLRVMGECLSLCYPGYATSKAEIWMMKEYKVQSSWTKLFVFSTINIPKNVFLPICFTKNGRIFGSNVNGRLMILNDKGWLLYQCTTCPDPEKYSYLRGGTYRESLLHCGVYRETLLPLPNDFEEAGDDSEEASEEDQLTSSLEEASEDGQE